MAQPRIGPLCGFNFQWMFIKGDDGKPIEADLRALDFMAKHDLRFVRIPTDYRFWTKDFDYFQPDEAVFEVLDRHLAACRERGLHMSLNLHRAPGYCINRNDLERHNLWLDAESQDAFAFLWEGFAKRYRGIPASDLSFDLVNEPPNVGQYGMTRENHAAVIRRAVAAIRSVDPERPIVIDGLGGGHYAMPELADLGVTHSCRGYQPMPVSHHRATWWDGHADAPYPAYPGVIWDGEVWDADTLREFYRPWREVEAQGVEVHVGEFGCFNQTPNADALRWLSDLFFLWREFGWGWAMWNFEGAFGIIGHGREGARFETMDGYEVDADLWHLMRR